MKIILEFEGADARAEALDAQHAIDYLVALDKIETEVRRLWKYEEHECNETYDTIDRLYDYVGNVLAELPGYER